MEQTQQFSYLRILDVPTNQMPFLTTETHSVICIGYSTYSLEIYLLAVVL